jgi:hypothetical protein
LVVFGDGGKRRCRPAVRCYGAIYI